MQRSRGFNPKRLICIYHIPPLLKESEEPGSCPPRRQMWYLENGLARGFRPAARGAPCTASLDGDSELRSVRRSSTQSAKLMQLSRGIPRESCIEAANPTRLICIYHIFYKLISCFYFVFRISIVFMCSELYHNKI